MDSQMILMALSEPIWFMQFILIVYRLIYILRA